MSVNIGVILGSNRPNRRGKAVADCFMGKTKNFGETNFELLDLEEINLPFLDEPMPPIMHQYQHDHTKNWSSKIASLDGFIIITPEYNHAYPAVLKNALDYLYFEWHKKPVSFVSYGAMSGGTRAVEQLRLVAIELQMINLKPQVIIPSIFKAVENNQLDESYVQGDISEVIKETIWWAEFLKPSRNQE